MELVERYLQAVSGYLPKGQAGDIIAELKDSLLSRIEDRESELGRALTEEEQQALLKQNGHPMLVASQFLPQQHLIGPSVYPYWWFGMRLVLMIVGIVYGIVGGIALVTSGNPIQSIIHTAFEFASTALVYIGVLTLVFALLDRHQVRIGLFDNWQPAKLAPVHDALKIKRGDMLFELIVGALFIGWWTNLLSFPSVIFHDGTALPFKLSSAWEPYWWTILILSAMELLLAAINFLSPYWSRDRLLLHIVLNVISIGLVYNLVQHDTLLLLTEQSNDNASIARIADLVNRSVHWVLAVIALIYAGEIIQAIRRLMRLR